MSSNFFARVDLLLQISDDVMCDVDVQISFNNRLFIRILGGVISFSGSDLVKVINVTFLHNLVMKFLTVAAQIFNKMEGFPIYMMYIPSLLQKY